jgi:hypothetical protein
MEHNDTRHKLSEYLDGSVTAKEKDEIEAHLKTCQQCSNALQELQKTVEHLKSIEEVEPPAWMTQKIMVKVRAGAEEKKKSLFQRFFFPLSVKLPLQAVAVLFLTMTAFYIYRNIQPTLIPSEAPVQEFAVRKEAPPPAPTLRDKHEAQKITKDALVPAMKAPQAPGCKALDIKQEYEKPAPPAALGKAAESVVAPEKAEEQSMRGKKKDTAAEHVTPAQAGAPALPQQHAESKLKSSVPTQRALGKASADKVVPIISMRVKDVDVAAREIEKALTQSGGSITRQEILGAKKIYVASIDARKLLYFKERLKSIGDARDESGWPVSQDGQIALKIELIENTDQP